MKKLALACIICMAPSAQAEWVIKNVTINREYKKTGHVSPEVWLIKYNTETGEMLRFITGLDVNNELVMKWQNISRLVSSTK